MIAKLRVGWIVAGCAPAVRTIVSSTRFHCNTGLTGESTECGWACADDDTADTRAIEHTNATTLSRLLIGHDLSGLQQRHGNRADISAPSSRRAVYPAASARANPSTASGARAFGCVDSRSAELIPGTKRGVAPQRQLVCPRRLNAATGIVSVAISRASATTEGRAHMERSMIWPLISWISLPTRIIQ